jgi:manganese/iron transport system ATP-binding protein/manganese/zinc/iron transport system ATP- binding protein
VLIARALVKDAQVLLLDEPFAGVDAASEERIHALFDELATEGRTLLVATHDVAQAKRWHRVLCLHGCQIAFGTPGEVLTSSTLERTYGDDLVVLDDGELAVQSHHHDHDHP